MEKSDKLISGEYETVMQAPCVVEAGGKKYKVRQVAQAVKLPIIGMGGIMNADDAIEFILAGASAVAVGTANFHNPYATEEIVKGIDAYMAKYGIEDIHELIGAVR